MQYASRVGVPTDPCLGVPAQQAKFYLKQEKFIYNFHGFYQNFIFVLTSKAGNIVQVIVCYKCKYNKAKEKLHM